ncbi:MAG: hypothetical protein MI747_04075 [Desulfobacterales bacterium]|nr:hypothetical protein [Desulfobacterales bacterium]
MRAKILISILFISLLTPGIGLARENYRIVTLQHQTFLPYTLSLSGFQSGLDGSKLARSIVVENYNAQSDLDALDRFIENLKTREDVDLIFSIGTRSTKKVVKQIRDIPIVFTDLGAPETSGVVTQWKGSGANYTGVETRNYVAIGVNLLHELMDFKRIGLIYLKGSPSHEAVVQKVGELGKKEGFEFISQGFALRDEHNKKYPREVIRKNIAQALNAVVPQVDVFYVQISNTFLKNFDLFHDCFRKYSVPSAGEPIYIKKGLVIGIGRHKKKFGAQCADYAVRILKGADPGKLPMDVGKEFSFSLNIEAATQVGYNPSIDILGAADEIYKNIESEK